MEIDPDENVFDEIKASTEVGWCESRGDFDFVAYIDLIDTDNVIHDWKFQKITPPETSNPAEESTQLLLYSAITGFPKVALDVFVILKKEIKVIQYTHTFTEKDKERAYKLIDDAYKMTRFGVYLPNKCGWQCSPDFCNFWKECHSE